MGRKWKSNGHKSGPITIKKAPVFSNPDKTQAAIDTIAEKNWADIIRETPLWFYVEVPEYDFKNYKKTGDIRGWIPKEDMLPAKWTQHNAHTKQFHFETSGNDMLAAIKIISKSQNQPIQIITDLPQGHATSDSIQTGDYNFDGYPDFRLQTWRSENGNTYHDYYLYNAKNQLFKKDSALSNLPNLVFNSQKKCIKSTSAEKQSFKRKTDRYQWINGRLMCIDR